MAGARDRANRGAARSHPNRRNAGLKDLGGGNVCPNEVNNITSPPPPLDPHRPGSAGGADEQQIHRLNLRVGLASLGVAALGVVVAYLAWTRPIAPPQPSQETPQPYQIILPQGVPYFGPTPPPEATPLWLDLDGGGGVSPPVQPGPRPGPKPTGTNGQTETPGIITAPVDPTDSSDSIQPEERLPDGGGTQVVPQPPSFVEAGPTPVPPDESETSQMRSSRIPAYLLLWAKEVLEKAEWAPATNDSGEACPDEVPVEFTLE